jgi:hypothetical protein
MIDMKKNLASCMYALVCIGVSACSMLFAPLVSAQNHPLKTIDPEVEVYLPKWRITDPDLALQMYRLFEYKLGTNELRDTLGRSLKKTDLDQTKIIVTAAPRRPNRAFQILQVQCGEAILHATDIDNDLVALLSGGKGATALTYAHEFLPPEKPRNLAVATPTQNFLFEPGLTNHAVVFSLFEQSIKVGESGFFIRNQIGTDPVGYHFWSAGEGKVTLRRPLYKNDDIATNKKFPYLVNAYLGAGYRLTSGLAGQNSPLGFVDNRILNAGPGAKVVAGLDMYLPKALPGFEGLGFSINVELPLADADGQRIDETSYGQYAVPNRATPVRPNFPVGSGDFSLAPLLRSTGQAGLFYHWWLNDKAEDYLRFDAGINYTDVREALVYTPIGERVKALTMNNVDGLASWRPREVGDWVYLRAEYRKQGEFPFGVSLQYANQIILGRAYLPLVGQWLFLEARYSRPLRETRPFEIPGGFFMISPIVRFTL